MASSNTTNTNITDGSGYSWFTHDGNTRVYVGDGGSSGTITTDTYDGTVSMPSIWASDTVIMERKIMTVKCCKCNKVVGKFYSTMIPDDTYCNMCHKLDKLKE